MSYKIIGDTLYDIVNSVPKLNTRTFNYEKTELKSFPNAIITPDDSQEYDYTSNKSEAHYNFKIRITEKNSKRSIMEDRIRILTDNVLDEIRKIPRTCEFGKFDIRTNFGYTNDEQPLRVVEINVDVIRTHDIN